MSIIKYNSSATSSASTASSGVAVGGGVTMEQISDAFLPAQPTDEEKTKYDVEVEGTFKKNVTLPSITLKSADGTKTATISLNDNGKLNVNKSIYLTYGTYIDLQGRQDDGYVNAIRAYDYDNNQLTHIIGFHGSSNTYKWIYLGGTYNNSWLKVTDEQVETKGNKFKIGDAPLIEWDSTNNAFKFNAPIYSTGDVVAFGTTGSDIQNVQDLINNYIKEHQGDFGGVDSVTIGTATGSGNVITGLSAAVSTDKRTITITPSKGITALTEHQDISGKADKATTLSGYGITDAKIANGVITLGTNTIKPLTSHQDLSGKSNTTHTHSVKINGTTKTIAASGGTAVDLGTYLTSHQDISGKADKTSTVSNVAYDSTNKKITKTINGTPSDVVSVSTLKSAMDAVTSTDLGNAISGEAQARINAINALDVASVGGSGKYIQAISQTDGKISATAATLNKSAVGLGNVDNTADANKNVASAVVANRLTTCKAYKNNANSYPWCRILSSSVMSGSYSDLGGVYMIHNAYQGGLFGIFRVIMRTNDVNATSGNEAQLTLQWIIKQADNSTWDIKAGFKKTKKNAYVDVYYRSSGNYASAVITKLESSHRGVVSDGDFAMIDSNETATEHTNCYASLGTQGAYRTYDIIVDCVHSANVGFANSANQLANVRTLWGNSFNGTANIDGTITMSEGADKRTVKITNTNIKFVATNKNGWNMNLTARNNADDTTLDTLIGGYGDADTYKYTYLGGTYNNPSMVIKSGQIGIGTTAPSQKLDVIGNANIKGSIYISNDANYYSGYIGTASDKMDILAPTDSGMNARPLYLGKRGGTHYMALLNNGNVGIGTDSPSQKLDVVGAGKFSASTRYALEVSTSATDTGAIISFNGTNSSEWAHVGCAADGRAYLFNYKAYKNNGNGVTGFGVDANANFFIGSTGSLNLASAKMMVSADGKMGIGTTSPQQRLHVSGASRTKYVDFYSKDGETTRAGWVGRGSDANDNLTLYSDNAAINIDSNAEINLKAVHKQVVKAGYGATALQSYACIGEAGTNCKVANLNFSVNGYDSKARLQFLENGNFYMGRNYETTIGNDNAAVRIATTGGLVLSSTAALSGTRDNAIYIRPLGSNSATNQVKFESTGVSINASSANGLVIKRTLANAGAFVNYFNCNQSNNAWRVGMNNDNKFAWTYSTDGLSSGTTELTLDTSGNLVATGDVTAYSDARLKSDIKDLEYRGPLEPKEYIKDGKKSIGFIAQEVREKYPELVLGEEKEDEYLSLNYGGITAVLAAENKELHKKVESLEERIEKLETLINKLIEEK